MIISINSTLKEGPWGGSNQFVKTIASYLQSKGHRVIFDLDEKFIDLILVIHPGGNSAYRNYGLLEIRDYMFFYPNTAVLFRANTSDVRRNSHDEEDLFFSMIKYSDFLVFISDYLRDYYISRGYTGDNYRIIKIGSDENIFNMDNKTKKSVGEKLRIVTHHWSDNYLKGFDIYERLDELLGKEPYKSMFEFTLIGRYPKSITFKNTNLVSPLSGTELAHELKRHHIYVSGSRHEPGGNHIVEALSCGLPVLYISSGALPEYCKDYGVEFDLTNFEEKLLLINDKYYELIDKIKDYSFNSTEMNEQYENLIKELVKNKSSLNRSEPKLIDRVKYSTMRRLKKVGISIKSVKRIIRCIKKELLSYKN